MTEYIVLSAREGGEEASWVFRGTTDARSAEDAIRRYAESLAGYAESLAGSSSVYDPMYVAVPKRSWQPVKVTAETRTHVVIGDAKTEATE